MLCLLNVIVEPKTIKLSRRKSKNVGCKLNLKGTLMRNFASFTHLFLLWVNNVLEIKYMCPSTSFFIINRMPNMPLTEFSSPQNAPVPCGKLHALHFTLRFSQNKANHTMFDLYERAYLLSAHTLLFALQMLLITKNRTLSSIDKYTA